MAYTGYQFIENVGSSILSVVPSINLANTGQTALYTPPSGKNLIVTNVLILITAATAVISVATARAGITPNYTEYVPATSLTGLDAANEYICLNETALGIVHSRIASGSIFSLDVTIAAVATTLTATAYTIGYLI